MSERMTAADWEAALEGHPDEYWASLELEMTGQHETMPVTTPSQSQHSPDKRWKDPYEEMIDRLREWAFLTNGNEFYHAKTNQRMSRPAFDLALAPFTPPIEVTSDGEKKMKKLPASKAIVEYLHGTVVADCIYRPDVRDAVFEREGIKYLNSYTQSSVPDADPRWHDHDAWRTIRDHLHNIIPEGADQIINFMAHNVQHPGQKILWAPIIVGVPGDGKTTIQRIMQSAMGQRHVQPVSNEALFSDFTAYAEGSCVRVLEEVRVHGNSRATAMDKLKPLITNDDVEIVRKGRDGLVVANVTNYMALSNHEDALAIDENDRRWGVSRTRFKNRAQAESELTREYWDRIYGAIKQHRSVIRGWLLSVDLSNFDRFAAPKMNSAKRLMIEVSRTGPESDVREALELGGCGVSYDVVATDCLNEKIKEMGGRQLNTSTLSNILREAGFRKFEGTVKWKGKNRRVYCRIGAFPSDMSETVMRLEIRDRLDKTDLFTLDAEP